MTRALVWLIAAATTAAAERPDSRHLEGCHALAVHAGLLNRSGYEADVSPGSVVSKVRVTGPLGSVSYSYWAAESWRVGVDAGVLGAETGTSVGIGEVTSESAVVVPLLFTAAWYPTSLAIGRSTRPFGSIAVGPYVGSATNTRAGTTVGAETVTETVGGVRARIGLDAFFGRRGRAGICAGYHLVSDFDRLIGDGRDYSGPELSAAIGVVWGGSR